jgi:hypothetical protein
VSWEALWKIVFFGSFGAFVVISLLIAVFGIAEIRGTFAGRREHRPGREGGGP